LERALFEVMVLLMWAWIWASGSYTPVDPFIGEHSKCNENLFALTL